MLKHKMALFYFCPCAYSCLPLTPAGRASLKYAVNKRDSTNCQRAFWSIVTDMHVCMHACLCATVHVLFSYV